MEVGGLVAEVVRGSGVVALRVQDGANLRGLALSGSHDVSTGTL